MFYDIPNFDLLKLYSYLSNTLSGFVYTRQNYRAFY